MRFLEKMSKYDWLAVVLIIAASILRLYNLEGSQQFLGDQGRDAMVVSRIFKEADPVFIGPVTSVGNMYLGPLYYYFMLPFLWLSYPSPMGPIYAVVVVGVMSVAATYWVGKKMLSARVGLIAAAFLTFSSVAINFSRFSWNPNIAPLFSVLMVYFTFLAWRKNANYWLGAALTFAILIQLHYVNLLMAGGAGIIWLISLVEKLKSKESLRPLIVNTLLAVLVIGLFQLPLLLFELKHDWLNTRAFVEIFTKEESFQASGGHSLVSKTVALFREIRSRSALLLLDTYFGKGAISRLVLAIIAVLTTVWAWFLRVNIDSSAKNKRKYQAGVVLIAYLIVSILGLSLYSHQVYEHYILFIFPIVFLLFAGILDFLIDRLKLLGWLLFIAVFAYFLRYNFSKMPYYDAGWQISDISYTASTIAERVQPGEKYNIVLLSETKDLYGQNYRYFLTTYRGKVPIDPEREVEVDTLFIINEEKKADDPLELPIYQIEIFPNKTPEEVYQIEGGPEIIVLRSLDSSQEEAK